MHFARKMLENVCLGSYWLKLHRFNHTYIFVCFETDVSFAVKIFSRDFVVTYTFLIRVCEGGDEICK